MPEGVAIASVKSPVSVVSVSAFFDDWVNDSTKSSLQNVMQVTCGEGKWTRKSVGLQEGSPSGSRLRFLLREELVQWIALVLPCFVAGRKVAKPGNPYFLQVHRDLGAGSFAGAGAVENDFAIARDLGVACGEF